MQLAEYSVYLVWVSSAIIHQVNDSAGPQFLHTSSVLRRHGSISSAPCKMAPNDGGHAGGASAFILGK